MPGIFRILECAFGARLQAETTRHLLWNNRGWMSIFTPGAINITRYFVIRGDCATLTTRISLPFPRFCLANWFHFYSRHCRQPAVVLTAKTSTSVAAIVSSDCVLELSSRPALPIDQRRSDSSQYGLLEAAPPRCWRATLQQLLIYFWSCECYYDIMRSIQNPGSNIAVYY